MSFLATVLISICVIWALITILFLIFFRIELKRTKIHEDSKISIKESMDLVNLPVVTFENNGNKYNFILDTGANNSIINKYCNIISSPSTTSYNVASVSGNIQSCNTVIINFNYKDFTFESLFNVLDLNDLFNEIKKNYGVTVHGILGTNFLDKYNYVIDFKDYKIYRRK